MNLKEASIMIS